MTGNSECPENRTASERSYKRHSGQKEDTVNTDQEEIDGGKEKDTKRESRSFFISTSCLFPRKQGKEN